MDCIKAWIRSIRMFSIENPSWAILVEGKRDKRALEMFGVQSVIELRARNYHDVADEISSRYRGVVVLTDFDPEGETIFKKLTRLFKTYGLKVDTSFRQKLKDCNVRFVEAIPEKMLQSR